MLSNIETFLVRLLRGTVVITASISVLITAGALLYAAYAAFSPEPTANLLGYLDRFRQATDPVNLIKETFPEDSNVYKDAVSTQDNIRYEHSNPSDDILFTEFNKFLDLSLGASFESQKQFSDWLYGNNSIQFRWSKSIDDENATNENNVNYLWRSLLLDYAKRLTFRSGPLGAARKQKLYPTSFDQLTAPTGPSHAPYFLVWFFTALSNQLQAVDSEFDAAKVQRFALGLTVPFALEVASGAFAYFFGMMLLFLFVSIEASVRGIVRIEEPPTVVKTD